MGTVGTSAIVDRGGGGYGGDATFLLQCSFRACMASADISTGGLI
jgi:hypothetical protein